MVRSKTKSLTLKVILTLVLGFIFIDQAPAFAGYHPHTALARRRRAQNKGIERPVGLLGGHAVQIHGRFNGQAAFAQALTGAFIHPRAYAMR